MLRNYITAALRNLVRNRLYAAINLVGLSASVAVALLVTVFVRDELSYDAFIPGSDAIYSVSSVYIGSGQTPSTSDIAPAPFAMSLKSYFPQIETIARALPVTASLRRGDIEAGESIYWVDPDFFTLLPLPVIDGSLRAFPDSADGLVISRQAAHKYFGRHDVVGEVLEIDRKHPLKIVAVVENLPPNTNLAADIFGAGRAAFSGLAKLDEDPNKRYFTVHTFLRLTPGTSIDEMSRELPAFMREQFPGPTEPNIQLALTPLSALHLEPSDHVKLKPRGDVSTLYALGAIAGLVVVLANINFVSLMTALAGRRGIEIGVRKVAGATRRKVFSQFTLESALYLLTSVTVGVLLTAALLPQLNRFLDRAMELELSRYPLHVAGAALALLGLCVVAGGYPAVTLSAFKPADVLKGAKTRTSGSALTRQGLVLAQFAILIGLIIAAVVISRQTTFALHDSLRLDRDQAIFIEGTSCSETFLAEMKKLPGVRAAACSWGGLNADGGYGSTISHEDVKLGTQVAAVDAGLFELYGLAPAAGRFFSRDFSTDAVQPGQTAATNPSIVINETAARLLGYAAPQEAIGRIVTWARPSVPRQFLPRMPSEIIGVVPDFSMLSIREAVPPMLYFADRSLYLDGSAPVGAMSVKLDGHAIPGTLTAIDQLWKAAGDPHPIKLGFLDARIQQLYADLSRTAKLVAAAAGVAVFIGCLGMVGLSTFIAEQRTKEIGIRKAMGATKANILRLILWQFAKPVLLANVAAWPVAYFAMRRWLEGFAYRIELEPWMFLGATFAALTIALVTVIGHALLVARARPVAALRYE